MTPFRLLALLLLLALPAGAAAASSPAGPPDGTYRYAITHSSEGPLGSHAITVTTEGEARRVTAERHIQVERLFITVYREDTTIEERWEQGRLLSYARVSDYGDKVTRLSATLRGDELAVEADGKASTLPGGLMSTHFWNPALVGETRLFSTEDGSLLAVSWTEAGEEEVLVGGQRVKASRYEMQGGERRTFWFDGQGRLVKMLIHRGGGETVTFQLEGFPG